jgi:hypothetical protein
MERFPSAAETSPPLVTLDALLPPRSNDATPSFSGSASGTETVTVRVSSGAETVRTLKAHPSGGSWATVNVSPPLPDGHYTALATEPGALNGGEPGTSNTVGFEVDTQPPKVTLSPVPARSNQSAPTFSGTASESTPVTVEVFRGPRPEGEILASAEARPENGGWATHSLSPALPSGEHTFTAIAIEPSEINNRPGKSAPVPFVVDTEAPVVRITAPESPSNDTKPSFSGTASEAGTVQVEIFEGSSVAGVPLETVFTHARGGVWSSPPAPALASGTHTFTAIASEESAIGNPTGSSQPVPFVIDTTSPRVTLNALPSPSANRAPSFSGTASDHTPLTVSIYRGATPEGKIVATVEAEVDHGRWASARSSLPALAWDEYTALATQPSSLKNPAGESAPVTFVVAPIAPTVLTQAPSSVTRTSAALYGSVDPHGAPVSSCYFEYGTSASYGNSIECGLVSELSAFPESATSPVPVFARIYGLTPNTTYHLRVVAAGEGGSALGADTSFTTLAPYVFNEGSAGAGAAPPTKPAAGGVAAYIASLLTPHGGAARIRALLRSGLFALRFKAPGAGAASIGWYYQPAIAKTGSRFARAPVLVGWGSQKFRGAGSGEMKIRLTSAGRRLLAAAWRIRLTATCVFNSAGAAPVRASGTFELKR